MDTFFTWFFDGIGTEIVRLVIGAFVGGLVGFHIGKRSKLHQSQKGGQRTKQTQIGSSENNGIAERKTTNQALVKQSQIVGDNSEQFQSGGSKNV
jgi:hypothetical protein